MAPFQFAVSESLSPPSKLILNSKLDIDLDEYRKGNNKKDNNNKLDNRIRTDYFITNITECDKEIFGL